MRYLCQKAYECSLELKALPQGLDSTVLIKAKPLETCLPCPLMQKVAASLYSEIKITLVCYPFD